MVEKYGERTFFKIYFWSKLFITIIASCTSFLPSFKFTFNVALTAAAFIPLYAYSYEKRIMPNFPWRMFVCIYILWDILTLAKLERAVMVKLAVLLLGSPEYWGIVKYAWQTDKARHGQSVSMEKSV